MLTRIVLDNYRSFGHVELNLCDRSGDPLHYALIYGENGSGKTNLMGSVEFLRNSVLTIVNAERLDALRDGPGPDLPDGDMPVIARGIETARVHLARSVMLMDPAPLRLLAADEAMAGSDGPMHLRYEFVAGGSRMMYDLVFTADGLLVREELGRFTKGTRTARQFLVEADGAGARVAFGDSVFGAEISRTLRRRIRATWGKNTLLAIIESESSRNNPEFMTSSVSEHVRDTIGFVKGVVMDTRFNRRDGWEIPVEGGRIPAGRLPLLRSMERAVSSYLVRLYSDIRSAGYEVERTGDAVEYSLHVDKVIAGEVRRIPIVSESSGTRKLLRMLPSLMACSIGGVALIDEFDSGIHDRLIRDMMSQVLPSLKGQLIITTHNTLLMEGADPAHLMVIRTDIRGYKEVRSFDSIAPTREGRHNNMRRYMDGLFDGIPVIGDLDLEDIAERYDAGKEVS